MARRKSRLSSQEAEIYRKYSELSMQGTEENANNYVELNRLLREYPWLDSKTISVELKVGKDIHEGKSIFQVFEEKLVALGRRL